MSKYEAEIYDSVVSLISSSLEWLIIYCFTSRSRIFHLYGDVTITGEGLQNLGLCSVLKAFEQGGIFIVPHLLWQGTSVFPVDLIRRTVPFSHLLRHTWGGGGSILTWILTGYIKSTYEWNWSLLIDKTSSMYLNVELKATARGLFLLM
jgi:hypothetical protein